MPQVIVNILLKVFSYIYAFFTKSNAQNGGGLMDKVISKVNQKSRSTVEILQQLYAERGGKWHEEVNIFGIRVSENPLSDKFNDYIGIAFLDHPTQTWQWRLYKGTTDPGRQWIQSSVNGGSGASFMGLGWQPDIWVVGAHKGRKHENGYQFVVDPALIALGAKQRVFRDRNQTGKQEDEKEFTAWEDLNCHCASFSYTGKDSELVGPWSAGCQVIQSRKDWNEFIGYIVNSQKYKADPKSRWSYMLFSREQMPQDFWISR